MNKEQLNIIDFPKSGKENLLMGNGFYNMDERDYRRAMGINISSLNYLDQSPAHMRWNTRYFKEFKSMDFGKKLHMYLLERDRFDSTYIIEPDFGNLRLKAIRENRDKWHEENKHLETIDPKDLEKINKIGEAIGNSLNAKMFIEEAIKNGLMEISCFFKASDSDLIRKGRVDILCPEFGAIIDLKTTKNASFEEFSKSYFNFRYYRQAAYYMDLVNDINPFLGINKYIIIAVENEPPFGISCYELQDQDIEIGREEYMEHLETYKYCVMVDRWPGYEDIVQKLSLPGWVYKRREYNGK